MNDPALRLEAVALGASVLDRDAIGEAMGLLSTLRPVVAASPEIQRAAEVAPTPTERLGILVAHARQLAAADASAAFVEAEAPRALARILAAVRAVEGVEAEGAVEASAIGSALAEVSWRVSTVVRGLPGPLVVVVARAVPSGQSFPRPRLVS